jgi:hypothetical protein
MESRARRHTSDVAAAYEQKTRRRETGQLFRAAPEVMAAAGAPGVLVAAIVRSGNRASIYEGVSTPHCCRGGRQCSTTTSAAPVLSTNGRTRL